MIVKRHLSNSIDIGSHIHDDLAFTRRFGFSQRVSHPEHSFCLLFAGSIRDPVTGINLSPVLCELPLFSQKRSIAIAGCICSGPQTAGSTSWSSRIVVVTSRGCCLLLSISFGKVVSYRKHRPAVGMLQLFFKSEYPIVEHKVCLARCWHRWHT